MNTEFPIRMSEISNWLRKAMALDHPHPFRTLSEGRPAAVLVLVGIRQETGTFEILVTRRTEHLATHKGQYAFPGGMRDVETETAEATALRETEEEIGIPSEEVEIFGRLPALWTPSGFYITPVVGLLRRPIDEVRVRPNPHEIDHWFWCRVDRLRESGIYSTEERTIDRDGASHTVSVDVYQIDGHRIWGVTGAMLRNFISRLEKVESNA